MSHSPFPDRVSDRPQEFKVLTVRPKVAWPTVLLFGISISIYTVSTYMGVSGYWPLMLSMGMNAICAYALFTVAHDASHNALSVYPKVNDLLGRISLWGFAVLPLFRAFRFVHMQHHLFTNEPEDPDMWVGDSNRWSLLFRCATLDLHYLVWYLARLSARPKDQVRDMLYSSVGGLAVLFALIHAGLGMELLIYWVLPSRLAICFLALTFDYWPPSPYKTTGRENKYQATSVRVGFEWLLTPLLLYQNYHLVHHLYPVVPFYRYRRLWKVREIHHLENRPLMVSIMGEELELTSFPPISPDQRAGGVD